MAVGSTAQASIPEVADRVPLTNRVPAPDPATVSLPRA